MYYEKVILVATKLFLTGIPVKILDLGHSMRT